MVNFSEKRLFSTIFRLFFHFQDNNFHRFWFWNAINVRMPLLYRYFTIILAYFEIKNSKNEEIWEIQEDQRRYMFIFWLLFRLVGISSISETGLFYVWIRSNILKRILHQIGQTSSFLIIDTVDPKNNTWSTWHGFRFILNHCVWDQNWFYWLRTQPLIGLSS